MRSFVAKILFVIACVFVQAACLNAECLQYFRGCSIAPIFGESFGMLLDELRTGSSDKVIYLLTRFPSPDYPFLDFPRNEYAEMLIRRIESRTILTRKRNVETPTWDGRAPAFIVDPMIWYFDPDSSVLKPRFAWFGVQPQSTTELDSTQHNAENLSRRTLWEFCSEPEVLPPPVRISAIIVALGQKTPLTNNRG